jgi:hypothetical protein
VGVRVADALLAGVVRDPLHDVAARAVVDRHRNQRVTGAVKLPSPESEKIEIALQFVPALGASPREELLRGHDEVARVGIATVMRSPPVLSPRGENFGERRVYGHLARHPGFRRRLLFPHTAFDGPFDREATERLHRRIVVAPAQCSDLAVTTPGEEEDRVQATSFPS